MTHAAAQPSQTLEFETERQQDAILDMLDETWLDAERTGVHLEIVSHAALFKSVATLVKLYGEDAVSDFMAVVSKRILAGEFTLGITKH